ncbi:DUF5984 family protein [Actinoallomurus bryophytorum]|uniref:DUF5984 family protein n=1 Tax=Actinoallomurus bryophytorum TaxID=1490222 RepID=UPI00114F95D4|nr:DUF5984 family protein [Actinoallomurus bryophytorum]
MIRFRFALTPMDRVQPWGWEEDPHLHWFGLTDGWYWIELGDQELLRYSPETLEWFGRDDLGLRHPYADYQVVRLWEDLIDLTPMVMQPVPNDLEPFISADVPERPDLDDDEDAWSAMVWCSEHYLDPGYLRAAPEVCAWRSLAGDDTVTVAWQHPRDDEIVFTAPQAGQVTVPTEAYLTAVRRLDTELMAAMHDRITELELVGPPQGVRIDMDQLRAEHHGRTTWLSEHLRFQPTTDWAAVRSGVQRILGD